MKLTIFSILILLLIHSKGVSQVKIGNNNEIVRDFSISKDGSRLFVPLNNRIEVWKTDSFSLVKTLYTEPHSPILAIEVNNTGGKMAFSTKDSSLMIWDINTYTKENVFDHQKSLITIIRYSPNDSLLAIVKADNTITIWDAKKLIPKYEIKIHTNDITGIVFLDNSKLISCSADHQIVIWDINQKKVVAKWIASNNWIRAISLNSSNTKLISCGDDGKAVIWEISDIKNPKQIYCERISFNWLTSCDFYSDDTYVISGHNKKVNIYFQLGVYSYKVSSYVNKVSFLPNRKELAIAVGTQNSGLLILDVKNMKYSK